MKELRYKLEMRGVPEPLANRVIEDFEKRGWQSDRRYAESVARTRFSRAYGPLRIRAELAAAGLSDELVNSVLNSADFNWGELARQACQRRFSGRPQGPEDWQKRYRFLAHRGFSAEQIHAVLKNMPDDEQPLT